MNAFWGATLDGILSGYTVDDNGSITPTSGSTDLSREMQQVIVFYAGIDVVRNHLRSLNTVFRAVAGPVEFETQKSANTLRDLLKELRDRRNLLLTRLSDLGETPTGYFDAVLARNESSWYGDAPYVSGVQGSL